NQVHLMALLTHDLPAGAVLRHILSRISSAEELLRFIDNDNGVIGQVIPGMRIVELIPLRLELVWLEASKVGIVDHPPLCLRLRINLLDGVQRLAVAHEAGTYVEHGSPMPSEQNPSCGHSGPKRRTT